MKGRLSSLGSVLSAVLPLTVSVSVYAQDWKGKARIEGRVVSQKGEPIAKAKVVLQLPRAKAGPTIETDAKGRFAYFGMAGGDWDVDVSAPGYETFRTNVHLSEITRIPPMDIKLIPAPVAAPIEASAAAPKNAGPDVIPLLEQGNALLEQKDYVGARAEYEKALETIPDNPAILRAVARAYYGEKKLDQAIATLKKAVEKEPGDSESLLLLANLELEKGNLEEGKATLEKIPPEAIKDPGIYVNVGILLLNKKKPQEAWEQFDKAVRLKADDADSYFYRGLSAYQMKKKAEAKSDFEKYLELAPNGSQAGDARDLLKSIR